MVVRQRRGEQVLANDRCRLDPDLRAAHVLLVLATGYLYVHREEALHIVTEFHQGIRSSRHFTMDSHTYTRLEMCSELMFLGHTERYRTLRHENLSVRLNPLRTSHPSGLAGEFLTNHHRQQDRNICLTTGRDAFVIEFGNRNATGVLNGCEEIETTDGDTIEFMLSGDARESPQLPSYRDRLRPVKRVPQMGYPPTRYSSSPTLLYSSHWKR